MTEPRLTRGEYWLLDSVVEYRFGMHYLLSPVLDQVLNKPPHGLSAERLTEVLVDLFARGWVEAGELLNDAPGRSLDRSEVIRALSITDGWQDPGGLWYGLTAAGGAVWEAFAAPDWSRYLSMALSMASDPLEGTGELTAANAKWPQQYLSLLYSQQQIVESGSETWDVLRPWQPVYWKTLPEGHRLRYRFVQDETPPTGPAWDAQVADNLTRWWCRWR